MTGFGEAEVESPAGRLHAEVRTVNHRFFSANVRVPGGLERYEAEIREWLRVRLPRGHVNCAVRLENGVGSRGQELRLNEQRALEYQRVLGEMKERLGLRGDVDLGLMSRIGGIIEEAEPELVEVPAEDVQAVTEQAAGAVIEMRRVEGERLRADLEARLAAVESCMVLVRQRAPLRLEAERDRLRRAVAELAGDVSVDEERLAREIAFLAERWDIGEEVVRLASHITLFREIMDAPDDEPAGKRLGFLVQEMHREANTMGAKANDAAIEHEVVAIKNEIERLREQVDNVE